MFFGMSSPSTMLRKVAMARARATETPRAGAFAQEAERRFDGARQGRLGHEPEQQGDHRQPELRTREVVREPPVHGQGHAGPALPGIGHRLEPAAIGGDDRELGRDEERGGQDQQGDGREAERRTYGCRRFMAR